MNKKKQIIVIAISAILLLAIGVGVFFVLTNNNQTDSQPTAVDSSSKTEEPSKYDELKDAENQQIKKDLEEMRTALLAFQNNNDGKIPGNWTTYFNRYAPELGKKYTHTVCDYMNFECKSMSDLSWDEDKYIVYIATNAECKSGYILKQTSEKRHIAFYTALQKNGNNTPYACSSN